MGSRILARIIAKMMRWWAEKMELLGENQAGFRTGRSTADATQVIMRIQEDVADYKKRRRQQPEKAAEREEQRMEARLLDLEKAYPRINKPCLWGMLKRAGLGGNYLRALMDLHETTQYKVKGKEGCSEPWYPQGGLRELCPTSPILFNIYHQVVMDTAERRRGEIAGEGRREVGIPWHCVLGSRLPGKLWEKFNSEARSHHFTSSLFADDTTLLGEEKEMQAAVPKIKETMEEFEEKNNCSKEEKMIFGDMLGERTRMLGCWMGNTEDLKQRKARAGKAWFKVKQQLKRSRLHKRTQARIVQACVTKKT